MLYQPTWETRTKSAFVLSSAGWTNTCSGRADGTREGKLKLAYRLPGLELRDGNKKKIKYLSLAGIKYLLKPFKSIK